ncbi:hypothetical protein BBK36DRAFT_1196006 [Trichoderma citrinoviride]|uniref:Uncharacterized protein n=1 Tax=Trichoderma citrinoviride TaxID=58853 RepID=A0A2T4BDB2_9HYPO|nr:hypothetical protein BBK36DRAFT_1196006 [Trichoderma citrinoviride]PTB67258.1 hypothetical protein BBK36DRAFT_1196006 [Trichoderma citrinoviride]
MAKLARGVAALSPFFPLSWCIGRGRTNQNCIQTKTGYTVIQELNLLHLRSSQSRLMHQQFPKNWAHPEAAGSNGRSPQPRSPQVPHTASFWSISPATELPRLLKRKIMTASHSIRHESGGLGISRLDKLG